MREGEIVLKRNILDIALEEEESPENYTPIFVWSFFLVQSLPVWYVAKGTQICWVSNYYYVYICGFIYLRSAAEVIEKTV